MKKGLLLVFLVLVASISAMPKGSHLHNSELEQMKYPGENLNSRVRRQNPMEKIPMEQNPIAGMQQGGENMKSMMGGDGIPGINPASAGEVPFPKPGFGGGGI